MNDVWWKLALAWLIWIVVVAALTGLKAPAGGAVAMGYSLSCSFSLTGLVLTGVGGYMAPGFVAARAGRQQKVSVWISAIGGLVALWLYLELLPIPRRC